MPKQKNVQYIPDEIDKNIINSLLENSKTTNREIAIKIGIAVGTVNTRIKRLEKEKIITKYSAFVDYEKLGYNIDVLISLKIKEGNFDKISKTLKKDKNIFMIFNLTGDYDAEIMARFHTRRQLDEFLKKLQHNEDIVSTSTRLVLDIIREKEVN